MPGRSQDIDPFLEGRGDGRGLGPHPVLAAWLPAKPRSRQGRQHRPGRGGGRGGAQTFMLSRDPAQREEHLNVFLSLTSCFKRRRELIGESNHGLVALGVKRLQRVSVELRDLC